MTINIHLKPAARAASSLASSALVALLLAACASPGPAHTPLAALSAAEAGLPNADSPLLAQRWWRGLHDERLNQLVDQALEGSPSLAVARARVERALAVADVSESLGRPQGTLSAEVTRQRYTKNGLVPPPIAGNTWDSGTLQAGMSWSPDFFGQHAAELASALGQARASQAEAVAAATALAAQVSRTYVGLARLLAQRDITARSLAQRQEVLGLTQKRAAAGLDSKVELTQSEAPLPDARNQLEALDEQIMLTRRQLAVLAAQPPNALDRLAPTLDTLALEPVAGELGADLLGRRPDVSAARWRVEAALQDVKVARTQFYPNVNLGAFVGFNALGLNHVLDFGSRQMGVSPALRLPLFDGGRLRAQLSARQSEVDVAIAQYNGVVLDAVKEAGDAIGSGQFIERQQHEQAQAMASAEKAYALALERFRAGLSNYLPVLNAESQVLAQRRLAIDLKARQLDTRLALMKALGGGWSDDKVAWNTYGHP